jgi:hypothetical protein
MCHFRVIIFSTLLDYLDPRVINSTHLVSIYPCLYVSIQYVYMYRQVRVL